jgi:hypothetical protein
MAAPSRSPQCRQALVIEVTFCVQGVVTASCGVPFSTVGRTSPSITPAFSHLRIRRSTRRSPIRCSTNRIIQSWLMLPNERTTDYPSPRRSGLDRGHTQAVDAWQVWRERMPVGLADSDLAERLDAVLELREIVDQLAETELPIGFGRD